jgi:DNA-binding transcriptional regulator YiaG
MSKSKKVDSFRKQMAQSMAELGSIMTRAQGFDGNGRFTVRTTRVQAPSGYRAGAIRALRERLGVSQAVFAQLLGVSQVLVRSWERGARTPTPIACRLLDIIGGNPEAITSLFHSVPPVSSKALSKTTSKAVSASKRRPASAA